MAYGDYDGPDKADKGLEGGSCNRRLCQAPDAIWWNHGSHAWYCEGCRNEIEFDHVNLRGWQRDHQPKCGHPMFETRAMIAIREHARRVKLAVLSLHDHGTRAGATSKSVQRAMSKEGFTASEMADAAAIMLGGVAQ